MSEKINISDEQLEAELMLLFSTGNTGKWGRSGVFEAIRSRYTLSRDRFIKLYDPTLSKWKLKVDTATDNAVSHEVKKAVTNGLKDKNTRMLEIQKILDSGTHEETYLDFKTKKAVKYLRALTPGEIKILHAEISQMNGDYAVHEIRLAGDKKNPLIPPGPSMDYSKLSVDDLLKLKELFVKSTEG